MPHLLISHWIRTPSYLLRLLEELPLPDSSHHIPMVRSEERRVGKEFISDTYLPCGDPTHQLADVSKTTGI